MSCAITPGASPVIDDRCCARAAASGSVSNPDITSAAIRRRCAACISTTLPSLSNEYTSLIPQALLASLASAQALAFLAGAALLPPGRPPPGNRAVAAALTLSQDQCPSDRR